MRIAVSMYGKQTNYETLCEALKGIEITELFGLKHELLHRYKKEFNVCLTEFPIQWGEVYGIPEEDISTNQYGKPYDRLAPKRAAKLVLEHAEAYVKVGGGDKSINELAAEAKLTLVKSSDTADDNQKFQYKF